jgi:predicted ATPase
MISSFHIRNFKSYREATLPLAPLTLLIGANASGKSNAIEAIRLLALVGDGRRIEDVRSEIQASDDLIRGNSIDLPHDRESPVVLGCTLEHGEWARLELALDFADDGASVQGESIRNVSGEYLYQSRADASVRGELVMQIREPGGQQRSALVGDRHAAFTWLESLLPYDAASPNSSPIGQIGAKFRDALESVRIIDPQPRRMRGYSYTGDQALKEDASNVSSVLHGMVSDDRLAGARILEFVSEIPEQPFVGLHFIVTDRRDIMVRLTESYGGQEAERDAPVLSDGTLRVLGIAAALLSAERGSTIIIEEIDNGVHPSRAETLLCNIERVAKERGLRVLLTTHNPALLDRLPADAIPHVVCAYRDPDQGDSRLVRLEDLPSYPELVARGPLGQLMTRGVLDYFVKHQETAEQKQDRARKWLHTLQEQVGDT